MFYLDPYNRTVPKDICKFLFYSQQGSFNNRYLLGYAFLYNYYVMLNNTDNNSPTIGFNGDYWEV